MGVFEWNSPNKQWTVRGSGNLQIYGQGRLGYRILLGADDSYELRLDHYVPLERLSKLTPMQDCSRSFHWNAIDYTDDNEGTQKTFAARFKTSKLANSFKDAFEKAQEWEYPESEHSESELHNPSK